MHMFREYGEQQQQIELLKEENQRLISERDAANERVAELHDGLEMVQDGFKRIKKMEERAHVTDWDEKLRVYLEEIKQQKDAATTYKNEKAYLTPWVKWIKKNGGRASN